MKYTNRHNIPQEIINAVHNDNYSRGKSTISATGLLQPPRIRLLAQEHYDKLTIDVSDEIWKLLGNKISDVISSDHKTDGIFDENKFPIIHIDSFGKFVPNKRKINHANFCIKKKNMRCCFRSKFIGQKTIFI